MLISVEETGKKISCSQVRRVWGCSILSHIVLC